MVIPFLIGHLVLPLFLFILLHLIEKYESHVIYI